MIIYILFICLFNERVIMLICEYQCLQCTSRFTELRRCAEMDSQIDCSGYGSGETNRNIR